MYLPATPVLVWWLSCLKGVGKQSVKVVFAIKFTEVRTRRGGRVRKCPSRAEATVHGGGGSKWSHYVYVSRRPEAHEGHLTTMSRLTQSWNPKLC